MVDYPSAWPSFFDDFMQFSRQGPDAADLYLRVLKSIDVYVVDREVSHSMEVVCLFVSHVQLFFILI